MEYYSTKELAKIWKISPTRIVVMAKKGQIKGAELLGKSWIFPLDVVKPADGRKVKFKKEEEFHFPIFLARDGLDADKNPEDALLFEATQFLWSGDFHTSYNKYKKLLASTKSNIIKGGLYYHLFLNCVLLKKYEEAVHIMEDLTTLISSDIPYKKELSLLKFDCLFYIKSNSDVYFDPAEYLDVHEECGPYIFCLSAYLESIKTLKTGCDSNTGSYEAYLISHEKYCHPKILACLHFYLTYIYYVKKDYKTASYHIKKAIDYCYENNYPLTVAINYFYVQDLAIKYQNDYPTEFVNKVRRISTRYRDVLYGFGEFLNSNIKYPTLTETDFEYLARLLREETTKEISNIKHISEQAVCRKIKSLCEKFEVKSKKELVKKYRAMMLLREVE